MKKFGAVSVAVVVPTPQLLTQLLREKPPCWTWAAFASVLFQRWAAVEVRKVDQVFGSPVQPTSSLGTGPEVARFIGRQMRAVDDVVAEATAALRAPAFLSAFGARGDEATADADGILRAAHRLGDHYERLLELAEETRSYSVPDEYAELVGDSTRFMNQHLQDFARFVNDVLERLEELQGRVMLGHSLTAMEPVTLRTTTDDSLVWSILDRLQAIE